MIDDIYYIDVKGEEKTDQIEELKLILGGSDALVKVEKDFATNDDAQDVMSGIEAIQLSAGKNTIQLKSDDLEFLNVLRCIDGTLV